MADFKGISEFHDGLAVSDYLNMIPLGPTCVDRVGDKLVVNPPTGLKFEVRGIFVDSHNNIYIAYGPSLYRYQYDDITGSVSEPQIMKMLVDGKLEDFRFINDTHKISFCESSLKPSEVFACDGKLIYAWATYDGITDLTYHKFNVNVICPPNISSTEEKENGALVFWTSEDLQPDFNSLVFGEKRNTPPGIALADEFKTMAVDMIDWFDNRLVATQLSKNTVWLTRTDPMYYWRDVNRNVPYLEANEATGGYELWPNWYSSSANSDKLLNICAYNGQLYFFNEHTIEIWGRTGNEDAPIQSNTQQVLHFGGTLPTIIEGALFFLGIDSMKQNFIGCFSPSFSKISNKEIERRLGKVKSFQKLYQYGETYLFVKQENDDGFVFGGGRWWRWETPVGANYRVIGSVIKDFAVADNASIIQFDSNSRLSGGCRIQRSVREGFRQFDKRVIIRKLELVADTGRTERPSGLDTKLDDKSIYCAISVNRGLSFSQRRYRTLGESGQNDKTIEWRNLGSGNSLLVEIGSSSLHKLQLYDIRIDLR